MSRVLRLEDCGLVGGRAVDGEGFAAQAVGAPVALRSVAAAAVQMARRGGGALLAVGAAGPAVGEEGGVDVGCRSGEEREDRREEEGEEAHCALPGSSVLRGGRAVGDSVGLLRVVRAPRTVRCL